MKAIILAGGYAKRLWPITKQQPKQLLPVAGKPIIEYPIEKIELTKSINQLIITVNAFFEFNFREWFTKYQFRKQSKLVIEKTYCEKEKLGSVGALAHLIKKIKINSASFVVAGDNLFEFSLIKFINYFREKKTSVFALYDIKNKQKIKGRYGVVELDENNGIVDFKEKPKRPKTSLVNTGCYILSRNDLKLVPKYLSEGNDPDILGNFLKWLTEKKTVHGYVFDDSWFDIGSFEAYNKANEYYREKMINFFKNRKEIISF